MKKIYILHGWAYSTERWKPFVDLLKKNGFEVEILKIPGLTVPLNEVWDIDNYVEWLSKILDKEKNAILLGHSNGGLIALSYTLKYPKKVNQLILLDSTGIYHNDLPIRTKRYIFATAAKIGKMFTTSEGMKKVLYKLAREHDYEKASPIVQKTMLNLIRTDLKERFSEIKTPTTIIWGGSDRVTPVTDGEILNREIKNSNLHIVQAARHSPQLTHPKETADVILNSFQDLKNKSQKEIDAETSSA